MVAVALDVLDRVDGWEKGSEKASLEAEGDFLSPEEIREKALEDRRNRAKSETFKVTPGEMLKGDHLLETADGRQYRVTLHDPHQGVGHCSCPDFNTNGLGTCKHLLFLTEQLKKDGRLGRRNGERFPFVDIYWDGIHHAPRLFCERPDRELTDVRPALNRYFRDDGRFAGDDLSDVLSLLSEVSAHKKVCVREEVLRRVDAHLRDREVEKRSRDPLPALSVFKARLYPYQEEQATRSEGSETTEAGVNRERAEVVDSDGDPSAGGQEGSSDRGASALAGQPAEKVEAVLNSGMAFIRGLMEMATGRKLAGTPDQERMIRLDSETGEVTMKFKLPGF